MAVGLPGLPELKPVKGVRLGTVCAGIKKPDRRDLVLIALADTATCAAVFTRNAFCAAPVIMAREHITLARAKMLLINTGNANAGTGDDGLVRAGQCCETVAQASGCKVQQVLPFSTGVIGEPLPAEKITAAIPSAYTRLDEDGWEDAAWGIMTTDTAPKGASRQIEINGCPVTVTGIAKGSGMIRPDMATMLAFIATDAAVTQSLLQHCLVRAVQQSFNHITVDGDTSTNDACVLMASGQSGLPIIDDSASVAFRQLCAVVTEVCKELAQKIIRDGEGATKFITIEVNEGGSEQECEAVAYSIAHSPLVKTAFFASDPNWGRILAAIGRSGLADLDLDRVNVHLDEVCIVSGGGRDPRYTEAQGQTVMKREEITIRVQLGRGNQSVQVWTCDFSYDYVRINAEYRT
ncbi:MAG: bifunctional ornithine acetyltransferase/N-acetylglutamate synthase [Gammaproteobacteria bacterium RBG_16_57_12]|nr:MAG: bifunctional ornithine acetyltransferase/N-acetylglutamate synthase [Gammaproteobacteria bacterium RBG_16_57_12]